MKLSIFLMHHIVLFATSFLSFAIARDTYDDFRGQAFCSRRSGMPGGPCCNDRNDDCAVPIAGTLCYCDQFCELHGSNRDCCPDFEDVCLRQPTLRPGPPCEEYTKKVNCNECKCDYDRSGSRICEQDPCLMDENMINDINGQSRNLGWSAKNYSIFYGRKLRDGLSLRLGTFEPRVRVRSMSRISNPLKSLPKEFNSLSHSMNYDTQLISRIRDQGWCGSSWAISTAGVASDRLSIASKNAVELAPQQFLSCVKDKKACRGGHLDNAWRYLNKNGLVNEECFQYQEKETACRFRLRGNNTLRTMRCRIPSSRPSEELYKMGPAYSLRNENDIMWEIYENGPVQATMWVYHDFFAYSSGIYRHSNLGDQHAKGFHSVRLVGWGQERSRRATKYWIAANSWGSWWGESGYFKILRGYNESGIEDYVISSLAHTDTNGYPRSKWDRRHERIRIESRTYRH